MPKHSAAWPQHGNAAQRELPVAGNEQPCATACQLTQLTQLTQPPAHPPLHLPTHPPHGCIHMGRSVTDVWYACQLSKIDPIAQHPRAGVGQDVLHNTHSMDGKGGGMLSKPSKVHPLHSMHSTHGSHLIRPALKVLLLAETVFAGGLPLWQPLGGLHA